MDSELWFSRHAGRLLAAAVEDGRIVEIHPETDAGAIRGAIYLARVQRIVPQLGAAFVQLAPGLEGYLEAPRAELSQLGSGQALAVQVRREAHGDKRARVTRDIELPGRAMSLRPAGEGAAVSRRINDRDERVRLERWAATAGPGRLVLRTAAHGVNESELTAERDRLAERAVRIARAAAAAAPQLLEPAPSLVERLILDFSGRGLRRVLVETDDDEVVAGATAGAGVAVERHAGGGRIAREQGILEAACAAMQSRIRLDGGGVVTLESTRALWAVDVDSGSSGGSALSVNREAASCVARELRLRDIAGTIVVDFLTLADALERTDLEARFREALRRDRRYLRLTGWTPLGLCEIARRREGPSLAERLASIGFC